MVSETAGWVVAATLIVGVLTLAVSVFNAWKAVQWKRAELAGSYLKDLFTDEELVFACRALEWQAVPLVVPERVAPLLPDGRRTIEHERSVMQGAMASGLSIDGMKLDPRIRIYRTALDGLLSWLALLDQAIQRGLFAPGDIVEAKYWLRIVSKARWLDAFIAEYEYDEPIDRLIERFGIEARPAEAHASAIAPDGPAAASGQAPGRTPAVRDGTSR